MEGSPNGDGEVTEVAFGGGGHGEERGVGGEER
jgi:hypothetical protein